MLFDSDLVKNKNRWFSNCELILYPEPVVLCQFNKGHNTEKNNPAKEKTS